MAEGLAPAGLPRRQGAGLAVVLELLGGPLAAAGARPDAPASRICLAWMICPGAPRPAAQFRARRTHMFQLHMWKYVQLRARIASRYSSNVTTLWSSPQWLSYHLLTPHSADSCSVRAGCARKTCSEGLRVRACA